MNLKRVASLALLFFCVAPFVALSAKRECAPALIQDNALIRQDPGSARWVRVGERLVEIGLRRAQRGRPMEQDDARWAAVGLQVMLDHGVDAEAVSSVAEQFLEAVYPKNFKFKHGKELPPATDGAGNSDSNNKRIGYAPESVRHSSSLRNKSELASMWEAFERWHSGVDFKGWSEHELMNLFVISAFTKDPQAVWPRKILSLLIKSATFEAVEVAVAIRSDALLMMIAKLALAEYFYGAGSDAEQLDYIETSIRALSVVSTKHKDEANALLIEVAEHLLSEKKLKGKSSDFRIKFYRSVLSAIRGTGVFYFDRGDHSSINGVSLHKGAPPAAAELSRKALSMMLKDTAVNQDLHLPDLYIAETLDAVGDPKQAKMMADYLMSLENDVVNLPTALHFYAIAGEKVPYAAALKKLIGLLPALWSDNVGVDSSWERGWTGSQLKWCVVPALKRAGDLLGMQKLLSVLENQVTPQIMVHSAGGRFDRDTHTYVREMIEVWGSLNDFALLPEWSFKPELTPLRKVKSNVMGWRNYTRENWMTGDAEWKSGPQYAFATAFSRSDREGMLQSIDRMIDLKELPGEHLADAYAAFTVLFEGSRRLDAPIDRE